MRNINIVKTDQYIINIDEIDVPKYLCVINDKQNINMIFKRSHDMIFTKPKYLN